MSLTLACIRISVSVKRLYNTYVTYTYTYHPFKFGFYASDTNGYADFGYILFYPSQNIQFYPSPIYSFILVFYTVLS